MKTYTANEVLDRLENNSGYEEIISGNEYDDKSDEAYHFKSQRSNHYVLVHMARQKNCPQRKENFSYMSSK